MKDVFLEGGWEKSFFKKKKSFLFGFGSQIALGVVCFHQILQTTRHMMWAKVEMSWYDYSCANEISGTLRMKQYLKMALIPTANSVALL